MAPFRRTSTRGAVTELPGATIVAIATTIDQHWIRAAGRHGEEQRAHVLCGHIHRGGDHHIGDEAEARIFVADAVVDHPSPLRLYEAHGGRLWAVDDRSRTPLVATAYA